MTTFIVGSVGIEFETSGGHANSYDFFTPLSSWFVYEMLGNDASKKNKVGKCPSSGEEYVDVEDDRKKA